MTQYRVFPITVAAIAAMTAAPAFAQDLDLSFNVGAATDYVWRGVSQTDENPQLSAGVDTTLWSRGYAGAWISNVDFGNGTDAEFDLYAGVRPQVGPITLDLGVVYYGYINQPSGPDQNFVELKAAGSMPIGPATLGAAVFYSDDFFGETGQATYVELNGSIPVAEKISISGSVGRQNVDYDGDYTTWNLGASYALNDVVGFDLRYHDTNEHGFGDLYGSRVVLAVKAVF
jgi:uncharacterized protein (TIGR02001 family)